MLSLGVDGMSHSGVDPRDVTDVRSATIYEHDETTCEKSEHGKYTSFEQGFSRTRHSDGIQVFSLFLYHTIYLWLYYENASRVKMSVLAPGPIIGRGGGAQLGLRPPLGDRCRATIPYGSTDPARCPTSTAGMHISTLLAKLVIIVISW